MEIIVQIWKWVAIFENRGIPSYPFLKKKSKKKKKPDYNNKKLLSFSACKIEEMSLGSGNGPGLRLTGACRKLGLELEIFSVGQ